MKVTYIGHSGFMVEWETCIWVFDYAQGSLPELSEEKKVLVFCSHKHGDHFHERIFTELKEHPQVIYVLSHDLRRSVKKLELLEEQMSRIHFMRPDEQIQLEDSENQKITVETLRSTDCGAAFLVTYDRETGRKVVYHAGDLNWWVWKGESKQEYNHMTALYKREIEKLQKMIKHIDVAFVPLDPRQEEWYALGMDYFMESVGADVVFPMHLWEAYDLIRTYKKRPESAAFADRIMEISKEGFEMIL